MDMKFTVIKNADIIEYLDDGEKSDLSRMLWKIGKLREQEGKVSQHTYLTVNVDESYASIVADIMQENGHWGITNDSNQLQLELVGDALVPPTVEVAYGEL
ncbi:MAG: hypothetical protein K6T94_21890 [Paenibacillus sp.]|nr:hypothetical protein [Paenibacillus sp.]